MPAQLILATACGGVTSRGEEDGVIGEMPGVSATFGTDGGGRSTVVTSGDPLGTCAAPFEFPASDDAWWQAEWTPSLPALPLASCGTPDNPDVAAAVVARWIAPHDGEYFARGWSKDFHAVFTISPQCGVMEQAACSMLEPQSLPQPPWDVRAIPGSAVNFVVKAGDAWFFFFQHLDPDGSLPPDRGIAIANISTTSF
jgi:hypothetical protein